MVSESDRIITSEIVKRINQNDMRLRELENLINGLEYAIRGLEGNVSDVSKDINAKIEKTREEMNGVLDVIDDVKRQADGIKKEFENFVRKDEFREVANYMSLMNPAISRFVTKEDVKKMLEELLLRK